MGARPAAFVLFGGFIAGRHPLFLETPKGLGLRVLVIDERSELIERQLALMAADHTHPLNHMDEIVLVSRADKLTILQQVAAWSKRYSIAGMHCLKETLVEAAGQAADWAGLPFPGLRAARICRNKYLQRLYLARWSPRSALLPPATRTRAAAGWTAFPAVLKPVGRHSSSGVRQVRDHESLERALAAHPVDEALLLEVRQRGREYSIEALVQREQVVFECVTQKRTNEDGGEYFVEMGHTVPAADLDEDARAGLLAVNRKVLERLSFQDGIAHAEYRLDAGGGVWLMEIAARSPGDAIPELYHLATGAPIEEACVRIALGEPVTYPQPSRFARQVYLEHPPGQLVDVEVDGWRPLWYLDAGALGVPARDRTEPSPALREVIVERTRGAVLGPIADSYDRVVSFLLDAPDPDDLDRLEADVRRRTRIVTERLRA